MAHKILALNGVFQLLLRPNHELHLCTLKSTFDMKSLFFRMRENFAKLGTTGAKVIIGGDSAGDP